MGKVVKMLLVSVLLVSFSSASFAEEEVVIEEPEPAAEESEPAPPKELTKEEMIERIKNMLGLGQELLGFLPELKVSYDEEGNITEVLYNKEGVWIDLDQLDEESLRKLHTRVSSERARIINERTMRQLRREQQRMRQERQMRKLREEQRRTRQERQLRQLRGQ